MWVGEVMIALLRVMNITSNKGKELSRNVRIDVIPRKVCLRRCWEILIGC